MNIWYLTSEYPPDFGGGISMYIENAATMFSTRGHKVTVLCRDAHGDSIEYINNKLRIIRFLHMRGEQYKYMGYWTALAYQYAEEVLGIIDKEGDAPDIIEVQEYNAIGYYLIQKKYLKDKRLENVKIVVHLHTPTFELARINQLPRYEFPTYWIGQMEKFCIRAADALVTQSEFLKKHIQPYANDKEIEVIPLPYQFKEETKLWNKCNNFDTDVLYLGRLEYRKGVINLLNSASKLWEDGYHFSITMMGGDTFFAPKQKMMGELLKEKYSKWIRNGNLKFKNSVHPSLLNDEIIKAKTVVIPSLYENYPYNCIIPMSMATSVIVSIDGGQAEMVKDHTTNGYIFDWKIDNDFEAKLKELLNKTTDELGDMGNKGYNRIKELCNIDTNYKLRNEFYFNVLNKKKNTLYPVSQSIPKKDTNGNQMKCEKGLLSIIIPYYNLGEYLLETLESAMTTLYRPIEIIIINDGSTDEKSKAVLEQIKQKSDSYIRIIDIPNGGLANARNVGALASNGEFIAFLDSDDLISPEFYSKSVDLLNTYSNVSFVYSWVKYFEARTGVWPTFDTEFPYFLGMNMLTAFVVVRRNDFINYGLNKKNMEYGMEDFDGWVSMCENGCSGISIPECLVNYRVRPESMSRQFNRDMVVYLLDKLSSNHPELYKTHGLEIYNLLVANGPGYLWNNATFEHPNVSYTGDKVEKNIENNNYAKYELMRVANSKLGSRLIKIFFKLKLNKIFK